MRADIARIEELTGASVSIKQVSRPGTVLGAELHMKLSGLTFAGQEKPGSLTLRIPRPLPDQPGMIVRGTTQQSRYIAGTYGLVDEGMLIQSFNHEQWNLRRAAEDLIPSMMREKRLTQRAAWGMVGEFEKRMMEAPEWIPSIDPGVHAGVEEYVNMRSQVQRLWAVGDEPNTVRALTEFEYAGLMERGGVNLPDGGLKPLYPGHSPAQIAKGVASTVDVRGALSMVPEAVPYGRRPLQFLRSGFTPTDAALEAIESSKTHQYFSWAAADTGISAPMMRAAYVSADLDPRLAGTGVTSEGQLLISNRMRDQRAVNQWQQFDVASDQLQELGDLIKGQTGSKWDINQTLPGGTVLGRGPDGRPVVLPQDMHISTATAFAKDKAKGDFIRVMGMKEIERMRYSKVFGGAKGMAVSVPQQYIEDVLTQHAGMAQSRGDIFSGIDTIITMDELKKNRGLHYNQMFTSLWDFNQQNMKSGMAKGSRFAKTPQAVIAEIRRAVLDADKFDHEKALGRIMGLARKANLTPHQMGRVFGAVPDIFDDLSALGPLSAAEAAEIKSGVATGATQLYFEGLGGPGAGRTATIEPRMFELLGSPHFGSAGLGLQSEVAERMIATYPERFMEQREITKSLRSVMKPGKGTLGEAAGDLLLKMDEEILPLKSTTLGISGVGNIYIPGAAEVSQLSEYQTAAGKGVLSPLGHSYRDVIETAAAYESKDVTADVMQRKLGSLQNALVGARVATVTGTKGALRNRLPGSVFLTAVQPTLTEKLAPNVVGITAPYAEQVFTEMEKLNLYDDFELKRMRLKFLKGEMIAGVLGRHPYIGPYSSQAVKFQMVAGSDPIAMINERLQNAVAFQGELDDASVNKFLEHSKRAYRGSKLTHRRALEMGAEKLGSPIRLSPFVGIAGKSKAGPADITLRKAMAGDAIKLGITEGGRLGRLSVSLQQHRAALLAGAGGLTDQARMDALGLLEWMEQTPISGKHIKTGSEAQMIHLLDDIQESLDKKSANGISDAANRVMTEAKMTGKRALRQGFTIAMEDIDTGEVTTRFIRGTDIDKTAKNIMKASGAFEASASGRASAARLREMIMGRGGFSTGQEAAQVMDPRVLEQSPMGGLFSRVTEETSTFSNLANRGQALSNKVGAAGRSMLKHARPLAIGTGLGLGLAAVLSEPPRILPPGANVAPTGIINANTGGSNMGTDIHPEGHVQGAPTAPSPMGQGSAPVAPGSGSGYRVNIRGNTNTSIDQRSLAQQLRGAGGGRARVNSIVHDQRSTMTPQRLSSMLRGD